MKIIIPKAYLPTVPVSDIITRLEKIVREEYLASPQPSDIKHLALNFIPIRKEPDKDEKHYQKKKNQRYDDLRKVASVILTSRKSYMDAALNHNEEILTIKCFANKYIELADKFKEKFGYEMNLFEFMRSYDRETFNRYEIPSSSEKKLELMGCAYKRLCKEPAGLKVLERKKKKDFMPYGILGLVRQ